MIFTRIHINIDNHIIMNIVMTPAQNAKWMVHKCSEVHVSAALIFGSPLFGRLVIRGGGKEWVVEGGSSCKKVKT